MALTYILVTGPRHYGTLFGWSLPVHDKKYLRLTEIGCGLQCKISSFVLAFSNRKSQALSVTKLQALSLLYAVSTTLACKDNTEHGKKAK